MATRAIVTSHPVIACNVCGRRLLRGELPDVFLVGGQRRIVCELCAPRAAAEGWLREDDNHSAAVLPRRQRRGGSLLGRLRQLRESSQRPLGRDDRELPSRAEALGDERRAGGLYDFLDSGSVEGLDDDADPYLVGALPVGPSLGSTNGDLGTDQHFADDREREASMAPPASTSGEMKVCRALEVFNASEQPRRVAGIARSLGVPSVAVHPAEESGSTVAIVVAWDLCWYRYVIDVGDEAAGTRLVAQGMELDELPEQDRVANAVADERGELSTLA
jgi:hypothetical protein